MALMTVCPARSERSSPGAWGGLGPRHRQEFYIPVVDVEASQLFDAVPGRGRESAGL